MKKAFSIVLLVNLLYAGAYSLGPSNVVSLQAQHPPQTPQEIFQQLADNCQQIEKLDVYGDFDDDSTFLREFEAVVAREFGLPDAVFMPSGVMAQSIALLIHQQQQRSECVRFACHHSSHLLLHEQDAYRELLGMECMVLPASGKEAIDGSAFLIPPLSYENVVEALDQRGTTNGTRIRDSVHTLLLELPHRELGGSLTPWTDILKMRDYCRAHNVAFHCDGARLWEATAGYQKSLQELAEPFDSVYLSFYKGLGAISGAMLLGSSEFCACARIWLRRFGGNIYTLMPYALSARLGYERYWLLNRPVSDSSNDDKKPMSFADKREKLREIVKRLQGDATIDGIVRFDPHVPEINMVHGYLRHSVEECTAASDRATKDTRIRALHRLRDVSAETHHSFQTKFEWSLGEANGKFPFEILNEDGEHLPSASVPRLNSCTRVVWSCFRLLLRAINSQSVSL